MLEEEFGVSHYKRRLVITMFGHWLSYARESIQVQEQSEEIVDGYLAAKFGNPSKRIAWDAAILVNRRCISKWMKFCVSGLRNRGQSLLGKIAREKLLLAKGVQRIKQYFVDEKSLRSHGIVSLRTTAQQHSIVSNFIHRRVLARQRKVLLALAAKSTMNNQILRCLCSRESTIYGMAREVFREWRVRIRKADHQLSSMRKAKYFSRNRQLIKGLDCLRNTRRRSFGWRQLYSYSDDHHCQFKMQRSLIWWHSWLRRRRKRVISPMYKALIFWKLRHGHRLFESWRAQLTDKLFRAQALKKLDEFHGRKQRLMVLFRLQELQQFRQEKRNFERQKLQESVPIRRFFAKLRGVLRWKSHSNSCRYSQLHIQKAIGFNKKHRFRQYIYDRMNGMYFPVVVRRQSAHWRRACFFHGTRRLSTFFAAWRSRIEDGNLGGSLVQRNDAYAALHHWKNAKLRLGLKQWIGYSRQKTAFRFCHRQSLIQAQPAFQRQRLLSRCFLVWKERTARSLQEQRQRIRQQYHLQPGKTPIHGKDTLKLPTDSLPVCAESKQLKSKIQEVLAQPKQKKAKSSSKDEETDLLRARPKPLQIDFPSLPSEVKYGAIAAMTPSQGDIWLECYSRNHHQQQLASNPPHLSSNLLYGNIPPWALSMSVSSSVSSLASMANNTLHSHLPAPEEKHFSKYIHQDLMHIPSIPLNPQVAAAIQPIMSLPYLSSSVPLDKVNEQANLTFKLARETPRDGVYRPSHWLDPIQNTSFANPRDYMHQYQSQQPRINFASSATIDSSNSPSSSSSSLSSLMYPFLSDPSLPITMEFVGQFLCRLQNMDPTKLKAMLKKSPEKKRLFQEFREVLKLLYTEELQMLQHGSRK